ncbi:transposon Tf2-8 polyprotein [Trichonephila clavipes]|nr:transposon Tf2-8 polyprotein [Trichonephila clavipes]
MCLADGQKSTSLVPITVRGRTFQIDLIFLPHAKGNRTLLGVDFLRTSGIIMDTHNNFWYFGDKLNFRILFSKDIPLPVDDSPVKINSSSCPTNSIPNEVPLHSNTVDETETNDLHLREKGQTPVPAQRFESIAMDLFGPLPETTEGMKWIFIVEDYTTKWVELFPLNCFVLDINQSLIPVHHPQANPVERKNRDLKPRLTMMVGNNHTLWIEKLPAIRFALNTAKCESTDHTAAYLTFARELRTLDQVNTDLRSVIHNDNFVPEFTPYLKRFEGYMSQIKENIEMSQDRQKTHTYADKSRRPCPNYKVNDLERRPYIVLYQRSPTTFVVASCAKPDKSLGVYHTSALTPFLNGTETQSPVVPLKKRGRPRKQPLIPRGTAGENVMSASTPPRQDGLRRCRGRM